MKRVLVIVDMQNDFISGSLGTEEAEAIVPVMQDRIKEYQDGETIVVFTKDTHFSNYLDTQEGKMLPVPHCIKGTEGWSIDKRISSIVDNGNFLKYASGTVINSRINKETFGSVFLSSLIEMWSEDKELEEVVLMGVCTDICVVSNALLIKAYCPEVLVTVDASCCAGVTPERHKAALETMKSCQINVINE